VDRARVGYSGSIAEIQLFIQGVNFGMFQGEARTMQAVQLNFIVIGEAASHIPNDVQEAYPEVP
jgi:uncharacterized protein with HEPN domain